MTAKREAELEAENRVLREQVASLERIVEQVTRAHYAPWYPGGYGTYWYNYPVTSGSGTVTLCSGDEQGIVNGPLSAPVSVTGLCWPWRGSPPRQW
jgi:hypothetical protein